MLRVTRAIDFSTSLRHWRSDLGDRANRELFGRKADQHGHNYRLEVTVRGEPDPVTGMVVNLSDLAELLDREIMSRFDHRDLNSDTPYFEKDPPTLENFSQVIYRILGDALPPDTLDRIRLYENPDLFVDMDGSEP